MTDPRIPNTLTIAGLDPSGGAGILADIKAMSALETYACAVVAALTAQNTRQVADISPVSPAFVRSQIDTLMSDVRIDAVKIGMLGQAPVIDATAQALAHWKPHHVVLDPVMVAKSGDLLLEQQAVGVLREAMVPQATVLTPNLPEAGVLLSSRPVETAKEMRRVVERLRRLMPDDNRRWVLLKGGHLPGNELIDMLHDGDRLIEFQSQRVHTQHTHGTGCTLSAAIAAMLARGLDVPGATRHAREYLLGAITQASRLSVGHGHGPVHHFHQWWKNSTLQ